jgi:SAM-dependent methyltransferase
MYFGRHLFFCKVKMFEIDQKDRFGDALSDYYYDQFKGPLLIHNTYGDPEEYPLDGFFFEFDEFTDLEKFALSLCRGRILDVGSAAGRHVLVLQQQGLDVTGLDNSGFCCKVMEERGIGSILHTDIFTMTSDLYDTVTLLMNGIGLAGTISGLELLLSKFKKIISSGGQLIFDSSDIQYIYDGYDIPADRYFGEMDFCYEYKGLKGDWFSWLYVDPNTLIDIASSTGWAAQVIYEDQTDHYLARLVHA